MNTIRIRKAKSGDGFKFKYYFVEQKRDVTTGEAREFAVTKNYTFQESKNLSEKDFKLAISKLIPEQPGASTRKIRKGNRKTSVPRSTVREAVKHMTKAITTVGTSATKAAQKMSKTIGSFDVHSRVGSQKVLEGEQLILTELKKDSKALTASEIGKRIFRNELNKKGVEFVVEVRGFKFYAYLNKHYTPMVNKGLVKVVGLTKGHRKMEKLWEAINV